jgi:hypothetical protein
MRWSAISVGETPATALTTLRFLLSASNTGREQPAMSGTRAIRRFARRMSLIGSDELPPAASHWLRPASVMTLPDA